MLSRTSSSSSTMQMVDLSCTAFPRPARRIKRPSQWYDVCAYRCPSYQDIRTRSPACFGRYADRERERHRRAELRVVGRLDAAALAFDDGAADRKSQSHAVGFGGEERIEDPVGVA